MNAIDNRSAWVGSWEQSVERIGDLPSIHSLPHFSPRVSELQAAATSQGFLAKIAETWRRLVSPVSTNETEIERLRKLIAKVLE